MKRVVIVLSAIPLLLIGCGQKPEPYIPDTTLKTIPTIVQQESKKVGTLYKDPNPTVTKVMQETTFDNTGKLMYRVWLSGNFVRKGISYPSITYSMFIDGSKVWSVSNGTWDDENIQ